MPSPFPPGSSGPASAPIPGSSDADRVLAYRNSANFRTVQRNDPSAVEILDTSVYSTIYHYDEGMDKWAKQKQEGSLFVVRRDKAPEYALFMLNRITVKNVMIPLVPGEMKVTIIDDSMMQVARRKEKIKYGIWFTEGIECIKRFRQTIVGICGEPAPRPMTEPTAGVTSTSVAAPDDGLSRLFAGLMTQPTPSVTPPAQVTQTSTTVTSYTTTSTTAPAPVPAPALAPAPAPSGAFHDPAIVPSPQVPTLADVLVPSAPQTNGAPNAPHETAFAPGQTVDDLLMSILGATPAPPPPRPSSSAVGTGPQAMSSAKVGDATFAQAAGRSPIPQPPQSTAAGQTPQQSQPQPQHPHAHSPLPQGPPQGPPQGWTQPSIPGQPLQQPGQPAPYPNGGSGTPVPFLPPIRDGTPLAPHPHHPHSMQHPPPHVPFDRGAARDAAVDAIFHSPRAGGVINATLDGRGGPGGPGAPGGHDVGQKIAFVNGLLALIHTDETFVEELWRSYLARSGRAG